MKPERKIAITVGVLFLIALIFNIIAMPIYQPILNAEDFLTNAYPNNTKLILGMFLDFICIPAIILIPIMFFPVLKKFDVSLAIGYIGFRAIEGMLFILSIINYFSLLSLSRIYLNSSTLDTSYFQNAGSSVRATTGWIFLIYIIFFALGALILYYLLFKSKLVPRFISIWGFIAGVIMLAGAVVGIFGFMDTMKIMTICGPPIALNEFVLSIWLITKGLKQTVI